MGTSLDLAIRSMPAAARRAVAGVVAAGTLDYDRTRHLPRLLPVGPDEIADRSAAARRAILARLGRALRAERNRGRAGHWTYDLNRHIGLAQAYAAERAALTGEARKGKAAAGFPAAAKRPG